MASGAPSVEDLDLPMLDILGMDRAEAVAAMAGARERGWLARSLLGFAVTTYDDAVALLRDRRFHSALSLIPAMSGVAPEESFMGRRRSILAMEGAEHARLRRLVAPAFTPAAADRLRPLMDGVMDALLDAVAPAGAADLVASVCEPYPVPVICALLGAPAADAPRFSSWATDIFRIFNGNLAEELPVVERAAGELDRYVRSMVEERRRRPADDLLSALVACEEAGDRLSTDELVMLAEAVLMAGTDTTRNQLACSLALFLDHPDQWALLARRPELAGRAVEESMRFLGAVRSTARVAAEDVEYRGVRFPAGTIVSIHLAGANRDPGAFADPDRFDLAAPRDTQQLTFGSGIHHCLGAALARAELQQALPMIARRLPGLAADGPVTWKPPTFGIWGPRSLPARWDAPA